MIRFDNKLRLAALTPLLLLVACSSVPRGDTPDTHAPVQVTVMTFNVENLFDNIDDPGKDDKAYLPIEAKRNQRHRDDCNQITVDRWRDECLNLDWNEATLNHKMTVLADTIRQVNGGRGADIIALQEIENIQVLERLRTEHLGDLRYLPAILIEGADSRGIDVAFLSRLPLASPPKLHPLALSDFPDRQRDTRGVLQADFRLPNGAVVSGFSVHFPAPFHPTGMRIAAYRHLEGLLRALPDNHHAFAAGDFNTTSREDAEHKMLDTYARSSWTIAHDIGCESCLGTQYYARDDSWSFLDMILFSAARGGNTTAHIRADSVQIANHNPAQLSHFGTPERFNAAQRTGVSDHWPMIATIELTQKQ
ncbi:MAG: endonuclease/exonuclease/phosphatase family protein [Woeseiaceae bacterium]